MKEIIKKGVLTGLAAFVLSASLAYGETDEERATSYIRVCRRDVVKAEEHIREDNLYLARGRLENVRVVCILGLEKKYFNKNNPAFYSSPLRKIFEELKREYIEARSKLPIPPLR